MPSGELSTRAQGEVEAQVLAIVRDEMKAQGVTQRALAAAAGISPAQVTRIFNGSKTARFSEVAAMCEALGLRLSDVLAQAERED